MGRRRSSKNALKDGVKREEIFITTKIWIDNYSSEEKARKSIESSLKKLGLDYADLILIHQPFGDEFSAWRAMSRLQKRQD